jgi:hypothetical protein
MRALDRLLRRAYTPAVKLRNLELAGFATRHIDWQQQRRAAPG